MYWSIYCCQGGVHVDMGGYLKRLKTTTFLISCSVHKKKRLVLLAVIRTKKKWTKNISPLGCWTIVLLVLVLLHGFISFLFLFFNIYQQYHVNNILPLIFEHNRHWNWSRIYHFSLLINCHFNTGEFFWIKLSLLFWVGGLRGF